MKLIGSKIENENREQLRNSNDSFVAKSKLRDALDSEGHSTDKACVLRWIPDQGEDKYVILVDGLYIICLELDRINLENPPIIKRIEFKEYMHGLSRSNQIQLLVAQDLVSKKPN
ncbi:hypothetical protein [Marinicella rhabdoformis]|uniref:hypothetical protein n=1 Tax=Marinicella rhabdoformis TaxID=2580566 RepID=UPI0012AEDAFF|nr:hypothetical protein [Marinicella rhabdoformis]